MQNRLKLVAGAALGLLLVWWFAKDQDWDAVLGAVRKADLRLLAIAAVLSLSTYAIRALRWRCLLDPIQPGVRFSNLFAATSLGFSAMFLIGRPGELVRPVALSAKESVRPSASFATISIERIFDAVTVAAIFALNLLFFDTPLADGVPLSTVRWAGALLLAAAATGIFGLVMLRRHRVGAVDFLARRTGFLGRRVRRMIVSYVEHFAEVLSVLHDRRELVIATAYSLLLWSVTGIANLIAIRAFGVRVSLTEAIFVFGFSLVGSLVPTPGGAAGAFHAATQNGLLLLGVERSAAAGISIVLHLLAFAAAPVFGLYFLARGGISASRLRAALREDLDSTAGFPTAVEVSADDTMTVSA